MKKVITYGTFDLFHEGHFRLLKRARELGDYLIVGVTSERFDEIRGKLNVVDTLGERIKNVRKSGFADEIIVEEHEGQKAADIRKYHIDTFVLGSDWKGTFDYLKDLCEVVYLERTPNISSTLLRRFKYPIIRLGIIGTGRIARRFVPEARFVSGINVSSVYNPRREHAADFAEEFGVIHYSDDLEEFWSAVDAVYIASPHETHYDYAKDALNRNKHVLCEKPMAFSVSQAEELFSLAKRQNKVLIEAIKTAYCPGFQQLIGIAKSGVIGRICDVEACFSRLTPPHVREMTDVEYGGSFTEFGSHTMLPIFKLLGTEFEKVHFESIRGAFGIDLYTKAHFTYKDGMATSKSGVGVKSEGQLLISGTKGYILAQSPWWLTKSFEVRFENPTQVDKYETKFLGDGLRYEISDFAYMIRGGEGRSVKFTEEESVAMARAMEAFIKERRRYQEDSGKIDAINNHGVKIWAHRGCSYMYPENTLEAFGAACEIQGLTGIELDIQLSKDGEIVVIHDETVDRTTDGKGKVRSYTLDELKKLRISFMDNVGEDVGTRIPTMKEVLALVKPYCEERGLLINIELKNSKEPYPGMEEKILELVKGYGMEEYVVYSSFAQESLKLLKRLNPYVQIGVLRGRLSEALKVLKDIEGDTFIEGETFIEAIHPSVDGMDVELPDEYRGRVVRVWNGLEPFYKEERRGMKEYDLVYLKGKGITDFITNVPEGYLGEG